MTAWISKDRLQQHNAHLELPRTLEDEFEGMPAIPRVAEDSVGPRLKGKVIIITGANSPLGIGRASAHQFARNGAQAIFICDLNDSFLAAHQREIQSKYSDVEVHPRKLDVTDEDAIRAVVEEAVKTYGRLDIMFANAGTGGTQRPFSEISKSEFLKTITTNTLSVFLATKHAANGMLITSPSKPHPSGSIIATSSVSALRANAGSADYSASKAAVVSLMQTASYQLPHPGIRCNAICPALIETEMTESWMGAKGRAEGKARWIEGLSPMRRIAVADEVARVALFLGSQEASHVNGQAWNVCGGHSAGHPFINTGA